VILVKDLQTKRFGYTQRAWTPKVWQLKVKDRWSQIVFVRHVSGGSVLEPSFDGDERAAAHIAVEPSRVEARYVVSALALNIARIIQLNLIRQFKH
jgi:hypothetical protein